jgi:uncharacterized protein (TIGR02588 family)
MSSRRKPAATGRSKPSAGAMRGARERAIPLLEWPVAALGAVLVGGAIAFLVYQSLLRDLSPPDIRLVAEQVLDLRNGYLVRFSAFNEGQSTAAEVAIEGELVGSDGEVEISEVVLDYLPPRSSREGGLLFENDPRAGALTLRARGYAKP